MNVENLLKRAARTEYALLRIPLDMVDTRVVRRYFDQSSPVRLTFDRAVQTLDIAVEHWLQEPDRRESRSYQPPSAPDGPSGAAPAPDAPSAPDVATEPDAATKPDEDAQVEVLTDELLDEQQTETFTGELADDDELRHVQAELAAKRLVEEQQEQRDSDGS